jgi:hypothetical protein
MLENAQPFVTTSQDGFFNRQLLGGHICGISTPAKGLFQRRDASLVVNHRGDLIPYLLDDTLGTVGCALSSSHELDVTCFLTFNGVRQQPFHAMGLQDSLQPPTNNNPARVKMVNSRSMIGIYRPSSACSPDTTSVRGGQTQWIQCGKLPLISLCRVHSSPSGAAAPTNFPARFFSVLSWRKGRTG